MISLCLPSPAETALLSHKSVSEGGQKHDAKQTSRPAGRFVSLTWERRSAHFLKSGASDRSKGVTLLKSLQEE